jgi:hypothetical protein
MSAARLAARAMLAAALSGGTALAVVRMRRPMLAVMMARAAALAVGAHRHVPRGLFVLLDLDQAQTFGGLIVVAFVLVRA